MSDIQLDPVFQREADDFAKKFATEHDLGPVDESEAFSATTVTYTFQSGASLRVWRWATGKLGHKVYR